MEKHEFKHAEILHGPFDPGGQPDTRTGQPMELGFFRLEHQRWHDGIQRGAEGSGALSGFLTLGACHALDPARRADRF